jgi:hypothetical protein
MALLKRNVPEMPATMKISNEKVLRHLACVAITTVVFLFLNWLNELAFLGLEQSAGVNWVFLPAGIRLLATLLFGFAGFEGLLLAGLYLNFHHFHFATDYRAWSGAFAGAAAPYLSYLFARGWFDLRGRFEGLSVRRLVFLAILCGVMSPVFHHTFMWVLTGTVDWAALGAMIVGDSVGIVIVLLLVKGLLVLAGRYDPAARFMRRWLA